MKIKQHARVALQSALATFFVALIVVAATQAATTIGNNISTGTVTTTGIMDITATSDTPLTVNGDTASTTLAVYQAGAGDIVNAFDGSTEVFTILDGGKIGVGSSTPYALLSVEALTGQQAFIVGSSSAELFKISENGTASFNGGGWPDADFTVQGDAQTSLFFIDASADKIGVASSTPYAVLSVEALTGQTAFSVGSSSAELFGISNNGSIAINSGGWAEADFTVQGDAQTSLFFIDASADRIGVASSTPYAVLSVEALTGQTAFSVGSSSAELFGISNNGSIAINSGGWAEADFTVQGDAQANLLQVDASADRVGIASSTPWGLLAVEQATETYSFIVMNSGSSTPSFMVEGVNGDGGVGIATTTATAMLSVGPGEGATTTIDLSKVCFRSVDDNGTEFYWWFSRLDGSVDSIGLATSTASCF